VIRLERATARRLCRSGTNGRDGRSCAATCRCDRAALLVELRPAWLPVGCPGWIRTTTSGFRTGVLLIELQGKNGGTEESHPNLHDASVAALLLELRPDGKVAEAGGLAPHSRGTLLVSSTAPAASAGSASVALQPDLSPPTRALEAPLCVLSYWKHRDWLPGWIHTSTRPA